MAGTCDCCNETSGSPWSKYVCSLQHEIGFKSSDPVTEL